MERTCKCGCGETVPAINRFSYINGHRTRKVTPGTPRRRKAALLKPKTLADLNEFHGLKRGALIDATQVPASALLPDNSAGSVTTERVIILQLGESKVQKLLDLLLQ